MIRIKKPLARKMYYSGHTITIVPCKCGVNNIVAKAELDIQKDINCGDEDVLTISNRFDRVVGEFEWYNCNSETGYYSHYYVTETDMNTYNMCQSMCGASL